MSNSIELLLTYRANDVPRDDEYERKLCATILDEAHQELIHILNDATLFHESDPMTRMYRNLLFARNKAKINLASTCKPELAHAVVYD
jgi:hypothetical protein